MAFGNVPVGTTGINPALAAAPVVEPVATSSAVQQLVDSYRQGAIGIDQIARAWGTQGPDIQAKNAASRAATQISREAVEPAAIEARRKATELQGAEAEVKRGSLMQEDAIAAWKRYQPPLYKLDEMGKPTKQFDFDAMAQGGFDYKHAEDWLASAQKALTGQRVEFQDPKTGQKRVKVVNGLGQDVTPDASNPTYRYYQQIVQDSMDVLRRTPSEVRSQFQKLPPGTASKRTVGEAPMGIALPEGTSEAPVVQMPAAAAGDPTISSLYEQLNQRGVAQVDQPNTVVAKNADGSPLTLGNLGAQLSAHGFSPQALGALTVGQAVELLKAKQPAAPVVEPAGGLAPGDYATKPTVPTAEPAAGYLPGQGMAAGPMPGGTPEEVRKDLDASQEMKDFSSKRLPASNFVDAAIHIRRGDAPMTAFGRPIMSQYDFSLLQAVRQLAVQTASGGMGRGTPELRQEVLEAHLPWTEKLEDWKQQLLKAGSLTPQARERFIKLGMDYVHNIEANARPRVLEAARRANTTPEQLFGPGTNEYNLAVGKSILDPLLPGGEAAAASGPAAAGGAAGKVVTLPSGMKVYRGADGRIYRAQ